MANEDSSRHFLITNFRCAKCGHRLTLNYEVPREVVDVYENLHQPTGADMVENTVAINPCKTCVKPAKEAGEAIKLLLSLAGEEE